MSAASSRTFTLQRSGKCFPFPTSHKNSEKVKKIKKYSSQVKMAISSIQFLHSLRPFNASYTTKTPRVSLGFRSSVNFNLCSLSSGFFVSSSARSRARALVRDKGERIEDYPPVTDSADDDQVTLSFFSLSIFI